MTVARPNGIQTQAWGYLLFHYSLPVPSSSAAMSLLMDLLTYDCPYTGKKRTAGYYPNDVPEIKYLLANRRSIAANYLVCWLLSHVLSFIFLEPRRQKSEESGDNEDEPYMEYFQREDIGKENASCHNLPSKLPSSVPWQNASQWKQ